VDGALSLALGREPVDDLLVARAVVSAVEAARVDHRAVAHVRQALVVASLIGIRALDHATDLEAVRTGEVVVAIVVARHGHDRAGPVLHQHIVGHEHRDPLAVDGVDDGPPERNPGLLAVLRPALLRRLEQRPIHVLANLGLVRRAGGKPEDVGMLRGDDEEGGAEERVRAGGENRIVGAEVLAVELHLRPLRAADPVALHRLHVLRPVDLVEVGDQPVGVVGDPEEPLLELAHLDLRAAALAVAVDDLLVREDGLVVGTPLDGRLGAVGEAALEQPQEDPLRPAVVRRIVRGVLAAPVDRDPPALEPVPVGGDRALGRLPRRHAGLDRVVLGREAERVVAHRMHDAKAAPPAVVRDRVAERVVLQVSDVRLARRVGEHLEDVVLGLGGIEPGLAGIRHLPGALPLPHLLPAGLDRARVVAVHRG
jgi:hypothetical protein